MTIENTLGFPSSPDDVDTVRLTWSNGNVEWCRGGTTIPFPRDALYVKVEYWLAIRPFGLPLDQLHPDCWEEEAAPTFTSNHFLYLYPRAQVTIDNS